MAVAIALLCVAVCGTKALASKIPTPRSPGQLARKWD